MTPTRTASMTSAVTSSRSARRKPLVGITEPRLFTPPLRRLGETTSMGPACIKFARDVCGIDLFPWQEWLLLHALELHPNGRFRFRNVVVLVARQNGKSTLSQVISLFALYVLGTDLVLGTAQDLDTAEEVWEGALDIIEETPRLARLAAKPIRVNGKKTIRLLSGERYKVKAANRGAGRGLSSDLIMLDELREHTSWDAWGAITKTTIARDNAQVWALSNAGDASSIVLRHLRAKAHESLGDPDGLSDVTVPDELDDLEDDLPDDSLGIFEWSAPPGCDVDDREAWRQANPSLGYTITERTIRSAQATDPDWVFRTEVLCQWSEGSLIGPFPPGSWESGVDPESSIAPDSPRAWCVDVSHDRGMSYIAVAGFRADGDPHVEVVAQRAGTSWVAGWFSEKDTRLAWPVTVQARGAPVSSLADDLSDIEGLTFVEWQGSALGAATGAFYDGVRCEVSDGLQPPRIWHRPQPVLDIAAATATIKPLGESYVWSRAKSPTDVAPLVAVTGALWALLQKPDLPITSAYEGRGLAVV